MPGTRSAYNQNAASARPAPPAHTAKKTTAATWPEVALSSAVG